MKEIRRMLPYRADLTYEVSGAPSALDLAIEVTGFSGRVVVGSWYGTQPAVLDLGSHFHRSRLSLVSSQVSSLAPALTGRWDRTRRYALVWELLETIRPARFITHRVPFEAAGDAYRLLTSGQEEVLQIILTYPESN
jgi:threonine dehydrogenase-like Zn-dependent dehydrogenase